MNRFQTLRCPSCAAPLDIPEAHEQYFRCIACNTALEDTAYEEPTPDIEVSTAPSDLDSADLRTYASTTDPGPTPAGSGRGVRLLIGLVFAVGAIAVAFSALGGSVEEAIDAVEGIAVTGSDEFAIYSFATGTMLSSETDNGDDLLAVAWSEDGQRIMYLDFESEPVTRWSVASSDVTVDLNDVIVATDTLVVITAERFLYALDRATGAPAYTLVLPDEVASYCRDCVQVFDGDEPVLVVLTSDGTLTALRTDTGASKWATRLPSDASRQVFSTGGDPTVITGTDGTDGVVQTYDLETGQATSAQVPTCDGPAGRVHPVDHVIPTPDGGYLWVGDVAAEACVQQWVPGADSPAWTAVLDAGPASLRADPSGSVIVGDRLVVPGRGGFWSVSVADGSARLVERLETDEIVPVGRTSTGIIIAEQSDRGSGEWSLVGVPDDPEVPVWEYLLTGDRLLADGLAMVNQRGWLTELFGDSIVVIDVDDEAGTASFTSVDVVTGVAAAPRPLTWNGDSAELAAVFGFAEGRVTLGVDRRVFVVDVETGDVLAAAP